MDKRILDIVNDFSSWRGNPFTLAALVEDAQKQIDIEAAAAESPPDPPAESP